MHWLRRGFEERGQMAMGKAGPQVGVMEIYNVSVNFHWPLRMLLPGGLAVVIWVDVAVATVFD